MQSRRGPLFFPELSLVPRFFVYLGLILCTGAMAGRSGFGLVYLGVSLSCFGMTWHFLSLSRWSNPENQREKYWDTKSLASAGMFAALSGLAFILYLFPA
jgi:hypothetical protein